jgi:hypothetical protein
MTCSDITRTSAEPTAGTAPVASGWLLVERDGAWGRDALTMSALDPAVGASLLAAGKAAAVKTVLIRRPGPHAHAGDAATSVILTHAGRTPWAEQVTIHDDRELLELDPAICAEPQPPGIGRPLDGPMFLVCTHGKRDRCCATLGRPIVDTLAALHPEQTWEVSHIGGHRFAGNLLVLPDGLAYGNLDVASALSAASRHLAGQLDVPYLRGRTALPQAAQAAEVFARRHLDIDLLDAVSIGETIRTDDRSRTELVVDGVPHLVEVVKEPLGEPRLLSCDADEPEDPGIYRLIAMHRG